MPVVLRDYQTQAIEGLRQEIRKGNRSIVLVSPTGCHAAGQMVMMFDGTSRLVESILPGDELMGPDSQPRRVLSLCHGVGTMIRIVPVKGTSFVVNEDHVLTLVRTNDGWSKSGSIVDLSVREYLTRSKTFRHIHKLFRVPIEFQAAGALPLDPYFLGVLLGDGEFNGSVSVCKPDAEIHQELEAQAAQFGLCVKAFGVGTSQVYRLTSGMRGGATNPLLEILNRLNLRHKGSAEKFVPEMYKTACRESRLALLAGLMDTDGSRAPGGYDFISKSPQLSADVAFLARSVGLAAYVAECTKSCQGGFTGTYYRVSISGDARIIPCRIERKRHAEPRRQVKDVLRTGFSIETVGNGEYFGFTLDGDGRYLLDDFTVTHNSGKTTIAGEMIRSAAARDKRILFLAHRKELISQCSRRLADMGVDHGIIRANDSRRRPWLRVHVCSVPTLIRRNPLPPADLIFIDEAHRARGASYEQILKQYPQAVCIGLTATPARSDGRGMGRLFSSMVECPSLGELTEMGHLVPTRVFAPARPDLTGVHTTAGDYKKDELARAVDKPKLVGDVVSHWMKYARERLTVVFAVSIAHSRHLRDEFLQARIAAEHLDGETPERERDAILERLSSGRTQVLCNVGVLTEGWDCPATSCAILARPTQSVGLYLQMAGRILRPHPGKLDALILDHAGCTLQHGFIDEERVRRHPAGGSQPAELDARCMWRQGQADLQSQETQRGPGDRAAAEDRRGAWIPTRLGMVSA